MEKPPKKESNRNSENKNVLKSNKKYGGKPLSLTRNGKTEELLEERQKSCKRNMQELSDSIKSPTCGSWASEKKKKCKIDRYVTYSAK
jgi:hypothetical protein